MLYALTAIASILSIIIMLVLVHELGHFFVAKLCGVKVQRFSIGFGKPLWSWYDKQGTEYALAPLPFGGYVKLLDGREGPVESADFPFAFDQRPLYQRFAIVVAGPLFNILFAVLAFWVVFSLGIVYVKPIVGAVVPGSPAAQVHIQPGDEVIAIGKQKTMHWAAVAMALVLHYGEQEPLVVTIKKPTAETEKVPLDLRNWSLNPLRPNPIESIGIKPYVPTKKGVAIAKMSEWAPNLLEQRHYSLFPAFTAAVAETYGFIVFNLVILYKMLTGVISLQSLGGPFSIVQVAVLAAEQGLVIYLNFLALLSISIAIINLLPIPGLDGAQLLYQLYELIFRRPVPMAVQLLAFRLGLIILLLVMAQALVNDLLRL